MSRFKNTKIRCNNREYTVKQILGEGGFSFVYTTDDSKVICKIQVISIPEINESFQNEKKILETINHPNIVALVGAVELKNKDEKLGILFLEACKNGNLFNYLQKLKGEKLEEEAIYQIAFEIVSAIQVLHKHKITHRDIKLENILLNDKKEWKLCDFGSTTDKVITKVDKQNRVAVQEQIQKKTTPIYRSPEQLDLYSNFEIGNKVDIFALGCIIFMMCFQKQPFETKLASINTQYFLPQKHPYSMSMIGLINLCFTPNPLYRPTASQLKEKLSELLSLNRCKSDKSQILIDTQNQYDPLIQKLRTLKHSNNEDKTVSSSFMDKMKRFYSQMTTQTEGWIGGFIEESDAAPNLKYNRSILSKCWQKRYKVEKVYSIIQQEVSNHADRPLVIIKILLLLHNFFRKGPPQAMTNKQVANICAKIFKKWKFITNSDINQQKRKNGLIIQSYSILAFLKVILCRKYNDFIEGNYSPTPFFTKRKDSKILNFQFIDDLLKYLQKLIAFHEVLIQTKYYPQIKEIILLSLIDEEYCLISLFVHLYCTLKQATNFIKGDVDEEQFIVKMKQTDAEFKILYSQVVEFFCWQSKNYESFKNNKIQLNQMVLFYVDGLQTFKKKSFVFDITDYLNFESQIYGLKLPESYEGVLKNIQQWKKQEKERQYLEYGQFKKKPQQSKMSGIVNEIKQNFNFFEKDADNMEYSHQSINKDFGNIEKMQQLRKSKIQHKIENTSLHDLVNTNFFVASKIQTQPKIQNNSQLYFQGAKVPENHIQQFKIFNRQPNVQSRIVYHPYYEQRQDQSNNQFNQFSIPNHQPVNHSKVQMVRPIGLITFDDDIPTEKQVDFNFRVNNISAPNVSSVVYGQSQRPTSFFNHSSVIKSLTIESIQCNIQKDSFVKETVVQQDYFCTVYKGIYQQTQQVSIKQLNFDLSHRSETLQNLVTNYKLKLHVNIASFVGICRSQNGVCILQQFCEGQSLYQVLHESSHTLSWQSRVSIAKQVAQGLMFLHYSSDPVVHRLLNSKNIKFTSSYIDGKSFKVKLTDYGIDKPFKQIFDHEPQLLKWVAPQVFKGYNFSQKTDVYSFSIVLWQLICRRVPYGHIQKYDQLIKVIDDEYLRPDTQWISQKCPREIRQLMMRCWNGDPYGRPEIKEIVQILNQVHFQDK